ncbi:MAG TPA: hypothetical protein PLU33_05625 [Treponemataceae bacterium]|nr:hypothetical protein [Treponemataceae bacterium]HQL04599.1 hypothetical protein [Treponemataceae bacterium]
MAVKCIKEHVILVSFYKQNLPRFIIMSLVWAALYTLMFYVNKIYNFKDLSFMYKTVILSLYYALNIFTVVYIKKRMVLHYLCKNKILNSAVTVLVSLALYTIFWYASVFVSLLLSSAAEKAGITNSIIVVLIRLLPIGTAVYFLQHIYDAVLCSKNSTGPRDFLRRYISVYKNISILPFLCFILACIKMLLLYYSFTEVSILCIIITAEVLYFFASAAMIERYVGKTM